MFGVSQSCGSEDAMKDPGKPKDPKTMSAIELLIRTKRRWRAPQWLRDYAKLKGWELRKRGRPRKTTER